MNFPLVALQKQISIFLVICFCSSISLADTSEVVNSSKNVSAFTNWPIVLLVLLGMIGFIFSLAWFVKRFGGMNFSGNRELKVVTSIALGTRERVALIDVKGRQFLIGVTTQQVSHLHTFDEAVIPMGGDEKLKQSDFMTKLQAVLSPVKMPEENTVEAQKRDGNAP